MKKICFFGNSEPPSKLLEIFRKMTPGKSGIWGQLQGTGNIEEADYFATIDRLPGDMIGRIPSNKTIFLGAHPETLRAYQNMDRFDALAKFDCKETVGFLEWWINFDYDYLMALKPPTKTKTLGAIVSNAETDKSHTLRKDWLKRFCEKDSLPFDLNGRIIPTNSMNKYYKGACGSLDPRGAAASGGNDHMSGKEQTYLEHKYMLEFDNIGKYYFSERVLDCLLLWAMPIYFGGQGLHNFIPDTAFRYLNIEGNGEDVVSIINSDFYEQHINDIAKARDTLLNELQLWPRVHKAIFSTYR